MIFLHYDCIISILLLSGFIKREIHFKQIEGLWFISNSDPVFSKKLSIYFNKQGYYILDGSEVEKGYYNLKEREIKITTENNNSCIFKIICRKKNKMILYNLESNLKYHFVKY